MVKPEQIELPALERQKKVNEDILEFWVYLFFFYIDTMQHNMRC